MTRGRFATRTAACALLALAVGCSPPPAGEPLAAAGPRLEVRDASARLLPGVGAIYLTVVNGGDAPDRLVAVETPAAAGAMLHATVEENETMKMVAHEHGFEIPAGAALELAPGGRHVMLMEPSSDYAAAETIPVTLRFEGAGEIEIEVPVREPGGS